MNVGLIGTGAISHKHAEAYREIGYKLVAVNDIFPEVGQGFAEKWGAEFVASYRELCRRQDIDYIDVCTYPNFRLQAVEECAAAGKHILVQKPISTNLETARKMLDVARAADIRLGVISQHRFDAGSMFLYKAINEGRLGRLLEADCYVKWRRPQSYYDKPGKGGWELEGGGALINQAIHSIDLVRWIAGPVRDIYAHWQLGAAHKMESEDVANAVIKFASGATGVIQGSTAFYPGYPERVEFHGTKGSAILTGDRLTAWDVEGDPGTDAPLARDVASGAADPMAISIEPIKAQFLDFGDAIRQRRKPLVAGEEGYAALEIIVGIYESARRGEKVNL
ncbi:MAG: Gfo/Idh/MocA family oxidoreductase [Acidobacteria bacterium]|nr:Gfo/Idh/MocA family oxidoreductase [Acidobacteriota bacterium]